MTVYVLDTNILSLVLRGDPTVMGRFTEAVEPDNTFIGCPLVWFEIRRGLLRRDAKRQLTRFEALFSTFLWRDFTAADWALASSLWVERLRAGQPIEDADLLIGAYARQRNATLVTNNTPDFAGLGLLLEAWD